MLISLIAQLVRGFRGAGLILGGFARSGEHAFIMVVGLIHG